MNFSTFTNALVEQVRPSVVVVRTRGGQGAGTVWDGPQGLIVTNHHVTPRSRTLVDTHDGRTLKATVVARDPDNDLALLHVAARDLPSLPVADTEHLRVGEIVVALGHPLGTAWAASAGIVSGGALWHDNFAQRFGRQRQLVQADVALAPGNSGGPLVNTAGTLVGICCMIAAPGVALAVPGSIVARFVSEYARHRHVRRAA